MSRWKKGLTELAFFEKNIFKHENTCWIWKGRISTNGRGIYTIGKIKVFAHRRALVLLRNENIENKIIRHLCRNKLCVNPEHLKAGTSQENAQDRLFHEEEFYLEHKDLIDKYTELYEKLNTLKANWISKKGPQIL